MFHKNSELAGYCSVLRALQLIGLTGDYGRRPSAVVIGFGATARGAVTALNAHGVHDVQVLTNRGVAAVGSPIHSVHIVQFDHEDTAPYLGHVMTDRGHVPPAPFLAESDIVVNCTLQDANAPLTYLRSEDVDTFRPGSLIVDVSCDEGMAFDWARPTSFAEPMFNVGPHVRYHAVDHSPSYLWDSATWDISGALLPFLRPVMDGAASWDEDETIGRAIETRDGHVVNPAILSFQDRSPDYPHVAHRTSVRLPPASTQVALGMSRNAWRRTRISRQELLMSHEGLHDHDRGLSHDLPTLVTRRRALGLFGGGTLAALVAGCSNDGGTTARTTAPTTDVVGDEIPEETAGPYPGDGSNGVNVLTDSGIVRSDITTSFGAASGVAAGVPLTIELAVLDVSNGGGALANAAIYLWHCDMDGLYSLYSQGVESENYLRGVQETDADGKVTFTSIYPGAYSGRWPHIHFEVYPSLDAATTASDKLRTSQIALPQDASALVYATDGYSQSARNLASSSLSTDNVFRDGYSLQLATVTGSVERGMTARLDVPV